MIDGFAGVTAIDTIAAAPMVKLVLPLTPPDVAVMVTVPVLDVVAKPAADIVAEPVPLVLLQVTDPVMSAVELSV